MIGVDRARARAPGSLRREGPKHLDSTIEPLVAAGRIRSEDFLRSIYGNDEVRQRLWSMQHGKCCFCERTYEDKHSTVEHFRPKTKATDLDGSHRMGYWWLAYEFRNLYFCCRNCNTLKRAFFPLAPASVPLQPRQKPWEATERALVLDPGLVDPEPHIVWRWKNRRDGYVPVGVTEEGRQTIRATQLDQRDTLNRLRHRYYRRELRPVIRAHRDARAQGDDPAVAEAKRRAHLLAQDEAEFAGLARFLFRRFGLL